MEVVIFKSIRYRTDFEHCKYMSIGINGSNLFKLCGSQFFSFMDKMIGIRKLPYDIKLVDLITEQILPPEIFVRLPNSCFDKSLPQNEKKAYWFDFHFKFRDDDPISEFGHVYDKSLKSAFVDQFSVTVPPVLDSFQDARGHSYRPYEAYVPYWYGYILLESFEDCKFIDRYLTAEIGSKKFKESLQKKYSQWITNYEHIYRPLSEFITVISQIYISRTSAESIYPDNEIYEHLVSVLGDITPEFFEKSIEDLLHLHMDWTRKSNGDGVKQYSKALSLLRQDIYYLYEWYRMSGADTTLLFKKFEYTDRQPYGWSQLKDVLDFDYYKFAEPFVRYATYYTENQQIHIGNISFKDIYKDLYQYLAFDPWIRAFDDMHKAINNRVDINLSHPRTLENLLILTIRTEVLIRSVLATISKQREPNGLKQVLEMLADFSNNMDLTIALRDITNQLVWGKTNLKYQPPDVFESANNYQSIKDLSQKQLDIARCFLTFATARNYFAHHYYSDAEFSRHVNKICGDVVKNCLFVIAYLSEISIQKPK